MRIVLQNNASSLYFRLGPETWTPSCKEAHDFTRVQSAVERAQKEKLTEVQIVIIVEGRSGLEFTPVQIRPLVQSWTQIASTARPVYDI